MRFPQAIRWHPSILPDGEKHCESKASIPTAQHSAEPQLGIINPNHLPRKPRGLAITPIFIIQNVSEVFRLVWTLQIYSAIQPKFQPSRLSLALGQQNSSPSGMAFFRRYRTKRYQFRDLPNITHNILYCYHVKCWRQRSFHFFIHSFVLNSFIPLISLFLSLNTLPFLLLRS